MRHLHVRDLAALFASLAAVAATTTLLRLFRGVSPATVALAFLLVVLATATLGRLRVAIVVSVVAMLALNRS